MSIAPELALLIADIVPFAWTIIDGNYDWQKGRTVLAANEAWCDMFKIPHTNLIGRNHYEAYGRGMKLAWVMDHNRVLSTMLPEEGVDKTGLIAVGKLWWRLVPHVIDDKKVLIIFCRPCITQSEAKKYNKILIGLVLIFAFELLKLLNTKFNLTSLEILEFVSNFVKSAMF